MLLLFVLPLCAALQTHGWFRLKDVHHLIARPLPERATLLYGDMDGFLAKMQPTAVAEYVVLASTGGCIHGFVHDTEQIRRCCWQGTPTVVEKIQIASDMIAWLKPLQPVDHVVHDLEDGWVLTMAKDSLH